jgi:ParB/RepB/Spo0J family partition protein
MITKPKTKRRRIQVEFIRISKLNWDRKKSPEGIERLAGSIEKVGQLNPIIVRPIGTSGRLVELIAGRRRYEALKHLGEKMAEVLEIRCDDETAEFISLDENLQIEKPNTAEWRKGLKRAHELLTVRIQREIDKSWEEYDEKPGGKSSKTKKKTEGRFRGAAPRNPLGGRPKEAAKEAREQLAKSYNVSETKVRRDLKHEAEA